MILGEWPATKFEALLGAWNRRNQVERLERSRDAMTSGLYGNPNYDPQKEGADPPRKAIMEEVHGEHVRRLRNIMDPDAEERRRQAAEEDYLRNPFFNSVRRMERMLLGRNYGATGSSEKPNSSSTNSIPWSMSS